VSGKKRRFSRGSLETITSERLEEIVTAAEQAAAKVIEDAEAEARLRLADARAEAEAAFARRIASLATATDSLIAQAADLRRRSDRLLESLEDVRAGLDEAFGREPAPEEEERPARPASRSHLSAVAPVAEPEPPRPEPLAETPAGARLLATQMAVSGSSREEIAARLRNGFEIEDTDALLDAILGPEE
jgi:hypothetical protein